MTIPYYKWLYGNNGSLDLNKFRHNCRGLANGHRTALHGHLLLLEGGGDFGCPSAKPYLAIWDVSWLGDVYPAENDHINISPTVSWHFWGSRWFSELPIRWEMVTRSQEAIDVCPPFLKGHEKWSPVCWGTSKRYRCHFGTNPLVGPLDRGFVFAVNPNTKPPGR